MPWNLTTGPKAFAELQSAFGFPVVNIPDSIKNDIREEYKTKSDIIPTNAVIPTNNENKQNYILEKDNQKDSANKLDNHQTDKELNSPIMNKTQQASVINQSSLRTTNIQNDYNLKPKSPLSQEMINQIRESFKNTSLTLRKGRRRTKNY